MGGKLHRTDRKTIAAFDFDGTITKCDTLPIFIRFISSTRHLFLGSLKMAPTLCLFMLKIISNNKAKETLFKIFFSGISIDQFNTVSETFTPLLEKVVNPLAMERIKWHQERHHQVVIISASAENWIQPWALKNGIDVVLATQLEVTDQIITGKFSTENCYGSEKVCRLLKQYPNKEEYILYAYGDSKGDKELLELADYSYYRSFDN